MMKKKTGRSTVRTPRDSARPATIREQRRPSDDEMGQAMTVLAEEVEALRVDVQKLRADLQILRAIAQNPSRSGSYRGVGRDRE